MAYSMAMINFNSLAQTGTLLSALGQTTTFQPRRDILTVNGLAEAKDFKLDKGERVVLVDSSADIIYIKECDDIGKYSLKVYECHDVTSQFEKENTPAVISRAEFDSLVSSISDLKKMMGGKENEHDAERKQQKLDFSNK